MTSAGPGASHPDGPGGPWGLARGAPLARWLAVVLVVGSSAAVLVLEVLAGRLLAPYVGVSLETYTGVIGTVLAGIAAGAWAGGALADRFDPRRLLPALLVGGGALTIASAPIVRGLGDRFDGGGTTGIVVLAACGVLPAATVLSAVAPAVVKLQLRDLGATGRTVGRLSALGTAGAIAGTFLTGFVLVAWAAVTTLLVTVGLALVAGGFALGAGAWRRRTLAGNRRRPAGALAGVVVTAGSLTGLAVVGPACDTETTYYCASIVVDATNPTGRTLVLDDLRHSYVDLADPTTLRFWYVRRIVDAIEVLAPPGPLDVAYLGGGGFTVPRYVRATRPGSHQVVFEIDAALYDLVRTRLAFDPGDDVEVVLGDGRQSLARRPTDSADVVVGDAFGSRAVPWHLATEEFVDEVARVLRPGGVYVANVIDEPGRRFLRAEAATIARVFPSVVVLLGPGMAAGGSGNAVIVAGNRPVDAAALDTRRVASGDGGALVADVDAFVAGTTILTDDFAPVDQLIQSGK